MAKAPIEIGIFTESLSDHFLISPNALHRGTEGYQGLTLLERGMLTALLTFHPGPGQCWNTSRADIDAIAPELGRDKISSIIKGLRTKRYLYTKRVNAGHGKFRWVWQVYMTARPEGFDPFTQPAIDGTTVDGDDVNGSDQQKHHVSAGHTIDGSSVTEQPSTREVPNPRRTKKNPPTPTTQTPAIEASTATGEDENTGEATAVTAAISHQPTWRSVAVRAALRQAIANGLPAPVAYKTIVDLARGDTYGPTTAGPQRIIAHGPWWTPGAVFVPAASKDTKPMCKRHQGQIAATCSACAGERHSAAQPTTPTTPFTPSTSVPTMARALFAQHGYRNRTAGRTS